MMLFCLVCFGWDLLFCVTRGYVWTIPVSSWKHFGSTAFLKYSYSEVRICTVYGAIWLEVQMFWANFRAETRLGGFAAAEDFVRRCLREGRSFQVQLLPRGVGFLFLILYPAASSSSSSSAASASSTIFHAQLCHTPSFTHNFVTHHFVTHLLSHTTFSHTTLSHTILHAQLCHTPSFTHTTLSHTIFHTPSFTYNLVRRGTWRHPLLFCVAGVALGDIYLRFAWQARHLWHWAGSGGALGLGLVAGDATALCVAGVALGDIHLRFTWQAWHWETSTFVLRGRRATYGTWLALVARLGLVGRR